MTGSPPDRSPLPRWLRSDQHAWGADPAQYDAAFVERVAARVGRLYGAGSWFGLSIDGWENVPPSPALLVSNHSGGTVIPDVWGFLIAWFRRFGPGRVCHPMAHDMLFAVPSVARPFARLGVLRARPTVGHDVLTRWGRDLFVCPGGDRETWRAYKDRYRVRFSGRRGYARLALRTGVPVTPVAHAGAHESLVVLTDGAGIARALHLPELFRAEIFPVHLSIPWGLGIGPLPHVPLPVPLRYRIGPVVPLPDGWTPREPSAVEVEAYDLRVRAALQGLLDTLAANAESIATRVRNLLAGRRAEGPPGR